MQANDQVVFVIYIMFCSKQKRTNSTFCEVHKKSPCPALLVREKLQPSCLNNGRICRPFMGSFSTSSFLIHWVATFGACFVQDSPADGCLLMVVSVPSDLADCVKAPLPQSLPCDKELNLMTHNSTALNAALKHAIYDICSLVAICPLKRETKKHTWTPTRVPTFAERQPTPARPCSCGSVWVAQPVGCCLNLSAPRFRTGVKWPISMFAYPCYSLYFQGHQKRPTKFDL